MKSCIFTKSMCAGCMHLVVKSCLQRRRLSINVLNDVGNVRLDIIIHELFYEWIFIYEACENAVLRQST